jgi:phosphoribosylglycinamide formyltransferase 1
LARVERACVNEPSRAVVGRGERRQWLSATLLGGPVRDHAVGRWPAEAEELGQDRLVRLQQALLVLGMRAALLGREETGSRDCGARARIECPSNILPCSDSAGEQQRVVGRQRRLYALKQLQRRFASTHMAAGLDALDDRCVGTGVVGSLCLRDRTALVDPGTARAALRLAPEGDYDVGRLGRLEPASLGEGKQQVDCDWTVRLRPGGDQLLLDCLGTENRNRAEAACLGDRHGQLVTADPTAHPGLDDRDREAKAIKKRHLAIMPLRGPSKSFETKRGQADQGRRERGVLCTRATEDVEMRRATFRLVVLASGSGTNLQAILNTLHGREEIEVAGVGSDKPGARALERAREAGVETAVFPRDEYAGREERDVAMAAWIEARDADLVVLAGYMQLLSPAFVTRFRNRIVNVHPALLPAFPGLDAIGQALAAGVETTGVTVHFVDEGVDTGPPIVQREVAVPVDRDRERLEEAIHAVEHELYPEAIRMIARGTVRIEADDPRVVVSDE